MIKQIKEIFCGNPKPLILDDVKVPENIKIMVLAPHPDDFDAIAVTLKKFFKCGCSMTLAVVSGSASGVEDSFMQNFTGKTKAEIREYEQIESCRFFGLKEDNIFFLRLAEDEKGDPIKDVAAITSIQKLIEQKTPQIVFLPHGNDSNQGHVRTYEMCRETIKNIGQPAILFLNRDPKTIEMSNDLYIVFDEKEATWKAELLCHHHSQHQRNLNIRGHGFDERVLAINRNIAKEIPGNHPYAEVFEIEEIK